MMFQSRVALFSVLIAVLLACGLCFAYFVQYVLHIEPCSMCYMQRYLFMGSIFLFLLVGVFYHRRSVLQYVALFSLVANLCFGVYHAGVEQKWWKGPQYCTSGESLNLANLTQEEALAALQTQLSKKKFVPCDRISWSIFSVSVTLWNSAFLFGLTIMYSMIIFLCRKKNFPKIFSK